MTAAWTASVALKGAGGEPVDLRRTVDGHGLTTLPPMAPDPDQRGFGIVLRVPRGRPLAVRVRQAGKASYSPGDALSFSPRANLFYRFDESGHPLMN